MPTDDFMAAVTPAEQPRETPRQRPDSVFSDAQIASIKNELELTKEQREPYWQEAEALLRDVAWDRNHGGGATLEPRSFGDLRRRLRISWRR
jgi:hypothetical protein